MNPEKAALRQSLTDEAIPPADTWLKVREELERRAISDRLQAHAEDPPASRWLSIAATWQKKVRAKRIGMSVAATTAFVLLLTLYRLYNPTADVSIDRTAQASVVENDSIGQPYPDQADRQPELEPEMEGAAQTTLPAKHSHTLSTSNDLNYVWVATENGQPMRVPLKWSELSCCLSGEVESAECRSQQTAWHAELATTGLGFQADPILGLMELIDPTKDR